MSESPSHCEVLIERYSENLAREFTHYAIDRACILVSPFLRADGESIEIEAQSTTGDSVRLSDMGESIAFLFVNGLTVSRSIGEAARKIARRYGVELSRGELTVIAAGPHDFGSKLHGLIQASLMVSDMIQRRRPSEIVQFPDVVEGFLVANRVIYDSDVPLLGRDNEHPVRFLVNRGSRPVALQPITAASEGAAFSWAERWAYRFSDIREANANVSTVAVLDDRGNRASVWTPRTTAPLRGRSSVILWKDSEEILSYLAASA